MPYGHAARTEFRVCPTDTLRERSMPYGQAARTDLGFRSKELENVIIIALSLLFWLTPVALAIHLAIKKAESNIYKKRLGYVYGGLWAIAFCGYAWLFMK